MNWSSRKKRGDTFCNVYFVRRKFLTYLSYLNVYCIEKTFTIYIPLHIKNQKLPKDFSASVEAVLKICEKKTCLID